jgi:hypothetical protein
VPDPITEIFCIICDYLLLLRMYEIPDILKA